MRLNIGVGPKPIHQQHLDIMQPLSEWTLVDYYVDDPDIKKWKAEDLQVEDGSVDEIYNSHLLEHLSHVQVPTVLKHWYNKLKAGGKLTINVPNLVWAAKQLYHYSQGKLLDGYYNRFDGEHGLISIFYGSQSHEGEYHKSGYTHDYLVKLLLEAGFKDIEVRSEFDAHDMGVLIATCTK